MSGTELRLFLGITAPEALLEALPALREEVGNPPGLRWVPEENLHLTVLFLGNVAEEMLPNLQTMIGQALTEFCPFSLTFDRFCFAPKSHRPRMIWARYRKQPDFRQLVNRMTDLYDQIKPGQQQRKSPIPHVTLARLRDFRPSPEHHVFPRGRHEFEVKSLVLWASELHPEGARYRVMEEWDL
jgi:2'-5' RNA ligase